jgi:tRNA nucleotidyltransferase (CCA-adding enzyme)
MVPGRPRATLVALAAVLACAPSDAAISAVDRLRLSARERSHVRGTLEASSSVPQDSSDVITALQAHRYYRRYGAAGADAAALVAVSPRTSPQRTANALHLMRIWLDHYDGIVAPAAMLSGSDLIALYGLQPGPLIGRLLSGLAEAQAEGSVRNREQALDMVDRTLREEQLKGQRD